MFRAASHNVHVLWVVVFYFVSLPDAGCRSAAADSCHEVKTAYVMRQIGPVELVPDRPGTDESLRVCVQPGPSCCTGKMEDSYMAAVRGETQQKMRSYSFELKYLIAGHAKAYRGGCIGAGRPLGEFGGIASTVSCYVSNRQQPQQHGVSSVSGAQSCERRCPPRSAARATHHSHGREGVWPPGGWSHDAQCKSLFLASHSSEPFSIGDLREVNRDIASLGASSCPSAPAAAIPEVVPS